VYSKHSVPTCRYAVDIVYHKQPWVIALSCTAASAALSLPLDVTGIKVYRVESRTMGLPAWKQWCASRVSLLYRPHSHGVAYLAQQRKSKSALKAREGNLLHVAGKGGFEIVYPDSVKAHGTRRQKHWRRFSFPPPDSQRRSAEG
jgi:hypothetical protein